MTRIPEDIRQVINRDQRRLTWAPSDQARAEALCARYGGILELRPVGTAGLVVQWTDPSGQAVAAEGTDPSAVLQLVAQSVEMGATTYLH